MRHGYLLLLVAGCGFKSSAINVDAAPPVPDGGVPGMWSFDSAADFTAPGRTVKDMTVEARGSLTPNAYTYGGLVAHGLQGMALWKHNDTSWTKLDGKAPSGAGLWRGERLTDAPGFNNNLNYLGIADPGSMTVWLEGEVWLEANSSEMFKLSGDDVAFFQIALPGTTDYGAVSDDNNNAIPVATPTTGWYPIRIGHSNGNGGNNIEFTHSESGGILVSWTRERLRARTSELSGMLRTVYARQILGGGLAGAPPVAHFDQSDLLASTDFNPVPQGTVNNDDWSAHYLGQVYVDQPGAYRLAITSDDGSRGRLGAGRGETHWGRDDDTGPTTYSVPATLVAGWNDVTVDYNQHGGGRRLGVQLAGPGAATPVEVPRDRLRPVEPADDRLAVVSDTDAHGVKDNGGTANDGTATMKVVGYLGETVTSIELTYEVTSAHWDQLKVDLETPAGPTSRLTVRNTGINDADGIVQLTITSTAPAGLSGLLGGSANGDWKLHVYDVVATGGDSLLTAAKLTLHTTGGPDKVARTSSWTSQVLDAQTNVVAIDGVTWDARLSTGTTVSVVVGTCQQADCSDVTWSGPVTQATAFAVGPARYLQLRVDMTSNGVLEPELRSLSVMYRRSVN